jgi:hypothetical protein
VRYITHEFAHVETLERAKRWLIEAGLDPSRIEVHTQGIPRLAVQAAPGEAAEIEQIIDAAESTDPQGNPSFWDIARQRHVYPQSAAPGTTPSEGQSESFVIGWRPLDASREVTQESTETEKQRAYREGRE